MDRNFRTMLEARWAEGKFVCVGLDSELAKIPQFLHCPDDGLSGLKDTIVTFNQRIIDATHDLVCAYKPNIALYEAHGESGISALWRTIQYIHKVAPNVPIILDAKRGDIGNTNDGYVKSAFDYYQADAITISPYLGREAMQPFLDRKDKGVFVLSRTSNSGAGEFQDLIVGDKPLYQHVAQHVAESWNTNGNCGLVVGATYPEELAKVRAIAGLMPLLIPGIGAQGGDLEETVRAGKNSLGTGMIINSSRGIIFASRGGDFADVARRETLELHNGITSSL